MIEVDLIPGRNLLGSIRDAVDGFIMDQMKHPSFIIVSQEEGFQVEEVLKNVESGFQVYDGGLKYMGIRIIRSIDVKLNKLYIV